MAAAINYGRDWVRIYLDDDTFRAGINYFLPKTTQYTISNLVDYTLDCRFNDLTTAVECLVEALGNPVEIDYERLKESENGRRKKTS